MPSIRSRPDRRFPSHRPPPDRGPARRPRRDPRLPAHPVGRNRPPVPALAVLLDLHGRGHRPPRSLGRRLDRVFADLPLRAPGDARHRPRTGGAPAPRPVVHAVALRPMARRERPGLAVRLRGDGGRRGLRPEPPRNRLVDAPDPPGGRIGGFVGGFTRPAGSSRNRHARSEPGFAPSAWPCTGPRPQSRSGSRAADGPPAPSRRTRCSR